MTYNRRAGELVGPPIKHYDELKKKETEKNKTALKNKKIYIIIIIFHVIQDDYTITIYLTHHEKYDHSHQHPSWS